jgi:hypothetical protein
MTTGVALVLMTAGALLVTPILFGSHREPTDLESTRASDLRLISKPFVEPSCEGGASDQAARPVSSDYEQFIRLGDVLIMGTLVDGDDVEVAR